VGLHPKPSAMHHTPHCMVSALMPHPIPPAGMTVQMDHTQVHLDCCKYRQKIPKALFLVTVTTTILLLGILLISCSS